MDQMCDNQAGGLVGRQLLQGQDRLQQCADVGHGEGGEDFDLQLLTQGGVARMRLRPVHLGFGHEPQGQGVQRRVMDPGAYLRATSSSQPPSDLLSWKMREMSQAAPLLAVGGNATNKTQSRSDTAYGQVEAKRAMSA